MNISERHNFPGPSPVALAGLFRGPWVSAVGWGALAALLALIEAFAAQRSVKLALVFAVAVIFAALVVSRPVLLLPIGVVTVNIEHLTFEGNAVTRLLAPAALLVVVVEVLRGGGRIRAAPPLWWACAYAGWALASALWTESLEGSRFLLQSLAIALVFLLAFAALLNTERELRVVLYAIGFIATLMGTLSVIAFGGNLTIPHVELLQDGRSQGGVGDPDFFAGMQLVAAPLILVLASETKHRQLRLGLHGALLAVLASVFTSLSRGGFLAVVLLAVLLLASNPEHVFRSRHEKAAALLVIALGMTFFFSRPFVRAEVVDRAETIYAPKTKEDETGSGRTNIWKAAIKTAGENPVLGIGFGSFIYVSEDLILNTPGVDLEVYGDRGEGSNYMAHNTYLGSAAELGLTGLALLLGVFVATGVMLRRTAKRAFAVGAPFVGRVAHALFLGLASWGVTSLFLSAETARMSWIIVGLCLALPKLLPAAEPVHSRGVGGRAI